jgi:hypothetical protein
MYIFHISMNGNCQFVYEYYCACVLMTLRKVLHSKDIINKFATVTITATSKFFSEEQGYNCTYNLLPQFISNFYC